MAEGKEREVSDPLARELLEISRQIDERNVQRISGRVSDAGWNSRDETAADALGNGAESGEGPVVDVGETA